MVFLSTLNLPFILIVVHLICTKGEDVDFRVSRGHASRGVDSIRITAISTPDIPMSSDIFQYQAPFKYRWTDKFLNTGILETAAGTEASFSINEQEYSVTIPAEGEGVRGCLIADPCFNNEYLNWCAYGDVFNTTERTPMLLNAINKHSDTHYWGILGDNFYDQNGLPTSAFFSKLSIASKTKLFVSVPGNHDYWVCGNPDCYDRTNDQQANGFMQYYGQDAYASLASFPYDFMVDPDSVEVTKEEDLRPAAGNFHLVNIIGNIGIIGFSGANSWEDQYQMFSEACEHLSSDKVKFIFVMGHWDLPGRGLENGMSVEAVHIRLREQVPSCANIPSENFKYVYGHTHCNRMIYRDTSYLVAGQGMDGCGNYGFPVFDTTNDQLKVYHFLIQDANKNVSNFDDIYKCIDANGVSNCYHLAEEWTVV